MLRHVTPRWEYRQVRLIDKYVVYYPFGLNMVHPTFSISKFVDALRG